MKPALFRCIFLLAGLILVLQLPSCKNNGLYIPNYKSLLGYVVGREICHNNADLDFWLVDFTYWDNQEQVGDTLTIQGVTYTNVVRVKGLSRNLKQPGLAVGIDYTDITSDPAMPTDCENPTANVYSLREITVKFQSEIH